MRHDRRGPDGKGPMTGRGLGICTEGVDLEGREPELRNMSQLPGRFFGRGGFGPGRGSAGGRGFARGRNAPAVSGRGLGRGLGRGGRGRGPW